MPLKHTNVTVFLFVTIILIVAGISNFVCIWAGVVAYDKLTGQIKWASPALLCDTGYVGTTIVKITADDHMVMIIDSDRGGSKREVLGMDTRKGERLWIYEGWSCRILIPNVIDIGGG